MSHAGSLDPFCRWEDWGVVTGLPLARLSRPSLRGQHLAQTQRSELESTIRFCGRPFCGISEQKCTLLPFINQSDSFKHSFPQKVWACSHTNSCFIKCFLNLSVPLRPELRVHRDHCPVSSESCRDSGDRGRKKGSSPFTDSQTISTWVVWACQSSNLLQSARALEVSPMRLRLGSKDNRLSLRPICACHLLGFLDWWNRNFLPNSVLTLCFS